jgi:hypothetical protein
MYHASLHGNSVIVHKLVVKSYFFQSLYSSRWQGKIYGSSTDNFWFPDICKKNSSVIKGNQMRYEINKGKNGVGVAMYYVNNKV